MEFVKRMLKALVASVIILIIAVVTALFINILAEFSPTLLIFLLVVSLVMSGYIFTED